MTRVLLRIQTEAGPRTIITQDFCTETAWAISNALDAAEIANQLTENATPLPLKALIKRRLASLSKPIVQNPSATITKLPVRKPRT